ncbi:MAG: sigma-70 family RNA polymerase sigma factor [Sphingomonadaceae bacterium]
MRLDGEHLRALMMGSLTGEAAATRALLTALLPVLRGYFGRRLGAAVDAEDLVQDTLIAVHTRRASYDPARPFTPWLFAIARYRLIDRYRRLRYDLDLDDIAGLVGDGGFEDAEGARMDIAALLATLPAKQAAAIRATKLEGLSVTETAARHDMSESDVKVSVHRGLKALARRLEGSE